ncbi:SDR family oxidoreductase [Methylovirgula sp. 4M-Z18]|uniref:SDR family oxidoreductase n=1 Tax=Methylovirgula sp. 4M-Z18 TaxID=2293567 RepID=UPI0013143107|nr:SDR family oxidoreductase [Methylovirgula sp. 4M-Z18]
MTARRILLVGATGVFGARLAAKLARLPDIVLIVTSRSRAKAEALAGRLRRVQPGARIESEAFDRTGDVGRALAHCRPWLVIDASGPFQTADYAFARAAVEAGAHWLDLADARSYILRFAAALAPLAQAKDVVALTGASSTPALSGAVVAALTKGWARVDTIDLAIVPGGKSPVGEAVVAAVLSYAGKAVPQWRDGRLQSATGWAQQVRMHFPQLGARSVAPVETADAELLSARFPGVRRIAFFAGLESPIEHYSLAVLAFLRKAGLARDWAFLAPWLQKARRFTRLGMSDRGGMVVRVSGLNAESVPVEASWSLLAEQGDGPHVPTLACVAAVRQLLAGRLAPGARVCAGEVDLTAIEAEMAPLAIRTQVGLEPGAHCLFADMLGRERYRQLPDAVQRFHGADTPPHWRGRADVEVGASWIQRVCHRLLGFAGPGRDVDIRVHVRRGPDGEVWTRSFAGQMVRSSLARGAANALVERFGIAACTIATDVSPDALTFSALDARLGPLPLPRWLAPRAIAREYEDAAGLFRFDVRIELPGVGLLVHYRGWLAPEEPDGT